jgi:hypothetical protein
VFFSAEVDAEAYAEAMRAQWQRAAEHEGLDMNDHGFSFERTYGAVADYIAKFGRQPLHAHTSWSAAAELTKAHLKRGQGEEHLTPFAMLWHISQGCQELKPIFIEYARWFKGKHQLVWSAGLRSLLLDDVEEKSDLELAQEPEEGVVLLGQLTSSQWRIVLINDARGKLLEVARSGNWQLVVAFLALIGGEHGPDPPI